MFVRSIIILNSRHNHTTGGVKVDSILQMLLGHESVFIRVFKADTLPRVLTRAHTHTHTHTHILNFCRYSTDINSKKKPDIKRQS
jgi:hypothetical protein